MTKGSSPPALFNSHEYVDLIKDRPYLEDAIFQKDVKYALSFLKFYKGILAPLTRIGEKLSGFFNGVSILRRNH